MFKWLFSKYVWHKAYILYSFNIDRWYILNVLSYFFFKDFYPCLSVKFVTDGRADTLCDGNS